LVSNRCIAETDYFQASLKQKEQARDNGRQLETQLQALQDILPELQYIVPKPEQLPNEIAAVEAELLQADIALQRLDDMSTTLEGLPMQGIQEEQLNDLSKQKQQLNSAIERVQAWREALIGQLNALKQWHEDYAKCQSDVLQISRQANDICNRYDKPQVIQAGVDDLKVAENIQIAINNEQLELKAINDRLRSQLPDPSRQTEEVERLKQEMANSSAQLKVCKLCVIVLF
jgi:hypothetical protein